MEPWQSALYRLTTPQAPRRIKWECGSPEHLLELPWGQGTPDPSLWVQPFLIRDTRGPHGCVSGVETTQMHGQREWGSVSQ